MVLPAKSIICMPCHTATFAAGDPITLIALLAFFSGVVLVGSTWFSAGNQTVGTGYKVVQAMRAVVASVFSRRLIAMIKIVSVDGLMQRRLFTVSKERWILHAVVVYGFMIRFAWGALALCASLWFPGWAGTAGMLDKNHPLTAFFFDFSGLMTLGGAAGMLGLRCYSRRNHRVTNLPPVDWPAYALVGGVMLVGFVLEGMRMAMTGSPGGAPYAFVGDAVSRMLRNLELTGLYGYVWYLHAGLTGALFAYLPFSGLFHVFMAPISMAINATQQSARKAH